MLILNSASVAVVIRLPFLHNYKDTDFLCMFNHIDRGGVLLTYSDSTYQIAVWSVLETGLGIVAGSLITLRPLLRWFLDGRIGYSRSKKYVGSSQKFRLSSLKTTKSIKSDSGKIQNGPSYWRPDIDDSNTIVTTVSSPRTCNFSDANSSKECLNPGLMRLPPNHVSIHKSITVTERQK
jgi:hypothetical protein